MNFGEDPHDLRLERKGGTRIYGTPQVQPGGHYDLTVRLLAGNLRALVQRRQPSPARDGDGAEGEGALLKGSQGVGCCRRPSRCHPPRGARRAWSPIGMNGLTAAVACAAVSTFGRLGAGTIEFAPMFVRTLRCRDSQAPISAATPLSALLWSAVTAPM